MDIKKLIVTTLILVLVFIGTFFSLHQLLFADSEVEPYSIVILAGQSWAEGTNSFKYNMASDSNGFNKRHYEPADSSTQLWWAEGDGNGPTDFFSFLDMFYNGNDVSGWVQSGGSAAVGAQRFRTLTDEDQRGGLFGPELGIGRQLYDMGRRKVIILKVAYGFQSLAKSNSPLIPFDFNVEPGRNKSYDRMKTEFTSLTNYLQSTGKTYTVDGLYWLQGGTDALQDSYASEYQANLTNFINTAKSDFKLHPQSNIVIGKISMSRCTENSFPLEGLYCGFPYAQSIEPLATAQLDVAHSNFVRRVNLVRSAQQVVSDNNRNEQIKVKIFDMNDIPISNDNVHYSELGNIEVGKRFVTMYKLPTRVEGSIDYDGDGVPNNNEDTGRGSSCQLSYNAASNNNLGDDDLDCDGYPNYLDKVNGPGSGLSQ